MRDFSKPHLIIFTGAPGSGKSTWATKLFSYIKSYYRNIKVEYLPEPIKILAYKKKLTQEDQDWHNETLISYLDILSKSGLHFVITDVDPRHSWILYGQDKYRERYEEILKRFYIRTFMVDRHPEFQAFGRTQSKEKAEALHQKLLKEMRGQYTHVISGAYVDYNYLGTEFTSISNIRLKYINEHLGGTKQC